MWTAHFWKDTVERAIRTAAQVAVGALTTSATIYEVDTKAVIGIVAISTVVSVLTAIGAAGIGDEGTASVLKNEVE